MDSREWIELLIIFFTSAVKFGIGGVPLAVFEAKYDFFMAITVTVSGGFTGTVFFTYLSDWLIKGIKKAKKKYTDPEKLKKQKKFTFTNKLIVKAKQRFGLKGIAFITPSLLSIPLGCFIAVRYYKDKRRIISAMCISIFLWAVFLYFFLRYLKDRV